MFGLELGLVLGIASLLVSVFVGLMLWTGSSIPLIWREIAINTRSLPTPVGTKGGRDAKGMPVMPTTKISVKSDYKDISVLSVLMQIMAFLIWIGGIISLIISVL